MARTGLRSHLLIGKLSALAFAVLIILGLEGVARLAYTPDALDAILAILRQDGKLFWTQRTNLDTTFFETALYSDGMSLRRSEPNLPTIGPKKQGMKRIVCLGGSPTFGWGVPYDKTYSAGIERQLHEKGIEKVEVINGGMVGYSSHQGLRFFRDRILPLAPDLITVAYVINDVDKYRFFRSNGRPDSELEDESESIVLLRNVLSYSRFFAFYERTLHTLLGRRGSFAGRPVEIYKPQQSRVPPKDYINNLSAITELARDNGISVVLIQMPVNLPIPEQLDQSKKESAALALRFAKKEIEANHIKKALDHLNRAVATNPYLSEAHYYRGATLRRLGKTDEAKAAFDDTMKSEAYRCGADGLRYNTLMKEVGKQAEVPVVDIASAFRTQSDYLFIGPKIDPIHPNAKGHALIAEKVASILANHLALKDKTHQY